MWYQGESGVTQTVVIQSSYAFEPLSLWVIKAMSSKRIAFLTYSDQINQYGSFCKCAWAKRCPGDFTKFNSGLEQRRVNEPLTRFDWLPIGCYQQCISKIGNGSPGLTFLKSQVLLSLHLCFTVEKSIESQEQLWICAMSLLGCGRQQASVAHEAAFRWLVLCEKSIEKLHFGCREGFFAQGQLWAWWTLYDIQDLNVWLPAMFMMREPSWSLPQLPSFQPWWHQGVSFGRWCVSCPKWYSLQMLNHSSKPFSARAFANTSKNTSSSI